MTIIEYTLSDLTDKEKHTFLSKLTDDEIISLAHMCKLNQLLDDTYYGHFEIIHYQDEGTLLIVNSKKMGSTSLIKLVTHIYMIIKKHTENV